LDPNSTISTTAAIKIFHGLSNRSPITFVPPWRAGQRRHVCKVFSHGFGPGPPTDGWSTEAINRNGRTARAPSRPGTYDGHVTVDGVVRSPAAAVKNLQPRTTRAGMCTWPACGTMSPGSLRAGHRDPLGEDELWEAALALPVQRT
jgi:hypothetical protein